MRIIALMLMLLAGASPADAQGWQTEVRNPRGENLRTDSTQSGNWEMNISTTQNLVQLSDGFQAPGIALNGFRIPKTSLETLIFQEGFSNNLNVEETWDVFSVGGGSVAVADGEGVLITTAAGQSIIIETQVPHPFTHGYSNLWRVRLILNDPFAVAGSTRSWGIFDENDGYLFRLNGNGLSAVIRRKTVETIIASSTWSNMTKSLEDMDARSYAIQYLNGNRVVFYLDDIPVAGAGSMVGSLIAKSNIPTRFENLQSLDVSTKTMKFTGLAVIREGSPFLFDSAGALVVSGSIAEAPEGTIAVKRPEGTSRLDVNPGSVTDDFYTITNDKTLVIQVLGASSASAGTGKSIIIELFDDPNGDESLLIPIPGAVLMGNNFNTERVISRTFSGDGVRRILMRITQDGNASMKIASEWRGFEQ